MSKSVLITIIVILFIVVVIGIYFIFISPNKGIVIPGLQNNSFDVQGVKVEIFKQGSGVGIKAGDYITVNYVGYLTDGKEFDSSIKRNAPFTFQLGQNRVIKGWDIGLVGMKVGEKRQLTIPPELGYGLNGFPPLIPQNSTLVFVVDLIKVGLP